MSRGIFHFSVNVKELELQPNGLSHMLYCQFIRKPAQTIILTIIFLKFRDFIGKWKKNHSIFYYKNNCTYIFHVFTIKIDIRNMSVSRKCRWKKYAKLTQDAFQSFFFFENPFSLSKNKTKQQQQQQNSLFYYKRRNAYKFHEFTIKNSFENMAESGELTFEKSLNVKIILQHK